MPLHEVIDQGDYWFVPINKRVTKYDTIPFQGGAIGGIGIDPATNRHSPAWLKYPKSLYSREEMENNGAITKIKAKCPVCDALDVIIDSANKPKAMVPAGRVTETVDYEVLPDEPTKKPVNKGPIEVSVGDIVPPKYITFGAGLVKKAVCTRLGDVVGSILLAATADLAAGYASDPGHKKACRTMSNSMIDDINLCPGDQEELKKYTKEFIKAYQEQGSLVNAIKRSMLKSSEEIFEDAGIEVNRTSTKTTNMTIKAGKIRPAQLID